jgi:hypothetical protein
MAALQNPRVTQASLLGTHNDVNIQPGPQLDHFSQEFGIERDSGNDASDAIDRELDNAVLVDKTPKSIFVT